MKLPLPTHNALAALAAEQEVSVGQIIRLAIEREIRRRSKTTMPTISNGRRVDRLRKRLADDFANSESWQTLQKRLSIKGYGLWDSGGGLILTDRATGNRVCETSELGYSHTHLRRKFRGAFPRQYRAMAYPHVMSAQHA